MSLPTRHIGPFTVSNVALGCMNLHHVYSTPPSLEYGARLLNHALDRGVTFIDTAAIYGMGESEKLVQSAIGHRRDEFILASKCVLDINPDKLVDGRPERTIDGRPENIRATLERALVKFGGKTIDLYYLHRPDRNVPVEDSVGELARAVERGDIRAIGLSEVSAETVARAQAVHPIAALQSEYSPTVRNPEVATLEHCRKTGVAFVAFSPVGRGILGGTLRDGQYVKGDIRGFMARYVEPQISENMKLVDRFIALAGDVGCTPAQLAMAWTMAQGEHVIALPGTRSIEHVDDLVGSAHIALSAETVAAVNDIFPWNAMKGARYPRAMQAGVTTELLPGEEVEA